MSTSTFTPPDPCSIRGGDETHNNHDHLGKQNDFFHQDDGLGDVEHLWSSGFIGFCQDQTYGATRRGSPFPPGHDHHHLLSPSHDFQQLFSEFFGETFQSPSFVDTNLEDSLLPEISKLLAPRPTEAKTLILSPAPSPMSSLELLNSYQLSRKCLNGTTGKPCELSESKMHHRTVESTDAKLSTEDIMRIAGERYVQLSANEEDNRSLLGHRSCFLLSGLDDEDMKNVELAGDLLAAAEKVSNGQYGRASYLLDQCDKRTSSTASDPVARVVYYYSEALRERIEKETGRAAARRLGARGKSAKEVMEELAVPHPILLVIYRLVPFQQVMQHTSVQAILDSTRSVARLHVIDLTLKHGLQWIILMQALASRRTASCPVGRLKLTAVAMSEGAVRDTGGRLRSFAEALELPFEFRAVVVPDMGDLREETLEVEDGEAVAVHCCTGLNFMLAAPGGLENLMGVVCKVRPCVLTVMDAEVNTNSVYFINRFVEGLFNSATFFDCLDACLGRDADAEAERASIEEHLLYPGIRSMVTAEGRERVIRMVGLAVWRRFFARFGLVEAELNEWSMYQAGLILKRFEYGGSCTLKMDGKSMKVGWKGTPLFFVSAWKFQDGSKG